jgi:ABC-2 type transport system ATP-binding protein
MTVADMIRFTRSFYPKWREDLEKRCLRMFELPLGRKTPALSKGMRSKLMLLLAMCRGAELLILDEPSDGLDPEGIHEMRETILRLHKEFGLTILLSSHLLNEVEQLCTRIAVLNQGKKVFDGTIAEATRNQNWLRLRTGDFAAATALLRAAKLIGAARDGKYITLSDGVGSDQVVRVLVENNQPVYEIAPQEETLESFYLALMKPGAN